MGEIMNIDVFIELVVFQSEGVQRVFDFLEKNRIKHITISPQYFVETGDTNDLRLPPLDLDGQSRELERPLFNGETVKYGRKYLCFAPDETLYAHTTYRPDYRDFDTDFCATVVEEAKKRKIRISVFMPNVPKGGYLPEDLPVDVYGKPQIPKISNEACRNADNAIQYYIALAKDLLRVYHPDEIMLDWMEFTDYFFSDNLLCFCDSCKKRMQHYGFSVERLEQAAKNVFDWVRAQPSAPTCDGMGWNSIWNHICPDISDLFEFKRRTVEERLLAFRAELDAAGGEDVTLLFTGFGLPMNHATGLNQNLCLNQRNIRIQPKAYRFHWGLMVRWYAQELAHINGRTKAEDWISFAKNLLEVHDSSFDLEHFTMPSPDEAGPIDFTSECDKVLETFENSEDKSRASIRIHGYGPVEIFRNRISFASKCGYRNISIQRYGYLCDEKINLLKEYNEP